jgi:hypothetical protein
LTKKSLKPKSNTILQNFQTRIKLYLKNERVLASFSDEKDLLEKFKGTPLNNDESEFIIIGNPIFNAKKLKS